MKVRVRRRPNDRRHFAQRIHEPDCAFRSCSSPKLAENHGRLAHDEAPPHSCEGIVKEKAQFELLREHLRAFPDLELDASDYEAAAIAFNRCRERGVQGSNTDFLICAAASRRDLAIFTTDADFQRYSRVLRLTLHEVRA